MPILPQDIINRSQYCSMMRSMSSQQTLPGFQEGPLLHHAKLNSLDEKKNQQKILNLLSRRGEGRKQMLIYETFHQLLRRCS